MTKRKNRTAHERPDERLREQLNRIHRERGLAAMVAGTSMHAETIARALLGEALTRGTIALLQAFVGQEGQR